MLEETETEDHREDNVLRGKNIDKSSFTCCQGSTVTAD